MRTEKNILVEVEGVGKKFSRNLKRSLFYGLQDVVGTFVGKGGGNRSNLRSDEFWAVKDVSFKLSRGECLGLIGHNGAGKSTLLKMLNGLIRPDEGSITMRGRVGALIELGTGFNPILSGRENIYINGQILGFSKKEIDEKLKSIIEFSELEEFIDSPVQSYSSGMKVRLGFAVAAQMEPDVLILDEVLAVGDVGFQGKCLKAITEMMSSAAVIFVSHSMPIVNRYCTRGILLDHGRILSDERNISGVIDKYLEAFDNKNVGNVYSSGQVCLESFSCNNSDLTGGEGNVDLHSNAIFDIQIKIEDVNIKELKLRINFINRGLMIVASVVTETIQVAGNKIHCKLRVGPVNLQPGHYRLSLNAFDRDFSNPLLIHDSIYRLEVTGANDFGGNAVLFNTELSIISDGASAAEST